MDIRPMTRPHMEIQRSTREEVREQLCGPDLTTGNTPTSREVFTVLRPPVHQLALHTALHELARMII